MTKKELKQQIDVHVYGRHRDSKLIAVFFDWKTDTENHVNGYKYCVYARACNATQAELFNFLYEFLKDNDCTIPYYVQTIVAPTDQQRFKVPIASGGLYNLVKHCTC